MWSIAEKETSEEIHIVRQEEARVDGMEAAGINTTMLVESRRLKTAFPRVPGSPTLVKWMRSKRSSRSVSLVLLDSAGECVKARKILPERSMTHCRRMRDARWTCSLTTFASLSASRIC